MDHTSKGQYQADAAVFHEASKIFHYNAANTVLILHARIKQMFIYTCIQWILESINATYYW